ncbi:MAG: hypothetical protein ACHQQ3_12095, partial [Gemmatimonadales bacterium]
MNDLFPGLRELVEDVPRDEVGERVVVESLFVKSEETKVVELRRPVGFRPESARDCDVPRFKVVPEAIQTAGTRKLDAIAKRVLEDQQQMPRDARDLPQIEERIGRVMQG